MPEVSSAKEVNDNYEPVEMDIDSNPGSPSTNFNSFKVVQ